MTTVQFASHVGTALTIDICLPCHALWFDGHESLQLSPASTLELFRIIAERTERPIAPAAKTLPCPRCQGRLRPTHDRQRDTRFEYLRCDAGHGRFITFLNFLREKNFVRPLTPEQLAELRRNVRELHCANCGAPIDLARGSECSHCGSPLSILDMGLAERTVKELRKASEPRAVSPTLALDLARARREAEAAFAFEQKGSDWWREVSNDGAVAAGLRAVLQLLSDR
jgi:hypothetical protein